MTSAQLLSVRIDSLDYASATERIIGWAAAGDSRVVCHANVHMLMEAHDDPSFAAFVNGADMVTADGMPLVWGLRAKGVGSASRVYGPTLMLRLLEAAEATGLRVAFYGSTDATVRALVVRMKSRFPAMKLVFTKSPPFFGADVGSAEDDRALVAADAQMTFVGLGCPKQERWMAARRGRVPGVLLGVGAAFDFHAGTVKNAPPALQSMGLEWAFRLALEPRRLFWRYAKHNPRFVALVARELVSVRLRSDTR